MTDQDLMELETFIENWQRRTNVERTDAGWKTYRRCIERIAENNIKQQQKKVKK